MSAAATARRRLLPAARTAIKTAAAAADVLTRPDAGITILIYHRVGAGTGGQMDLPLAEFEAQLRWLAENRHLITLDEAVDRIRAAAPESEEASGSGTQQHGAGQSGADQSGADQRWRQRRAVDQDRATVVTFDDGTTDWVDHVLPALDRHRVPATFYVATWFIEERAALPGEGRPISWAGLRELAASEWATVGSHTHRHMLLDRLDRAAIADELDRSVDLLGERLGARAEHFAYPKAVAGSPEAERAVRERFRSAVLAGTRANPPGTDPHRLHRSPIQAADSGRWFHRKARGGLRAEDDLRRLANRLRYRKVAS